MKRFYLPLFWKFIIAIIGIVALFGSINVILILRNVTSSLQKESQKRVQFIVKNLADQAIDLILYEDYISLQNFVDAILQRDKTIAYVFILDKDNEIMVHSFSQGVPTGLLNANLIAEDHSEHIELIRSKNSPGNIIRDLAVPIFDGELGTIRVGVIEASVQYEVKKTITVLLIMVGVFLTFGMIGAFIFAKIITTPIKSISYVADQVDFDALQSRSQPRIKIRQRFLGHFQTLFRAHDELDFLADKFNSMIERLENAYGELETAHAKLIQSEKLASVGTLAAGIAHEVNNPVAGIQNCIRRIKKNPDNMKQNLEYLFMMEEAANKIEHVVRGLLDYTRPQKMAFRVVKITYIVEKALSLVAYKLEKTNITVSEKFPSQLPAIWGSPNHLEQVFVNLFMNSIAAIVDRSDMDPKCERRIDIYSEIVNSSLAIHVSDTGIGISAENQKNIFDPFYTTKDIGKGTGLGLSICLNIIKAHNGDIKLTKQTGKRTTFVIVLPLRNNKD